MLNFPIKSWEGIWIQRYFDVEYLFLFKQNFKENLLWASPVAQIKVKKSAWNAGEPGLIPGSEGSPGEGNGYPLQYSCLENSVDRPWGPKESDTTEWLILLLWGQGVIISVSPSANSLSIFCRGQVWNKSPNMFQTCLVVKLLDVNCCFGRKLRPRDVKGHGAAELEWRCGAQDSWGPGCSAPLLRLESSLLTPGLGFFRGAKLPWLAKSEVQSILSLL